jgi:hypothetical protein
MGPRGSDRNEPAYGSVLQNFQKPFDDKPLSTPLVWPPGVGHHTTG